jgi:outer membrane lipoprotein SlyB
LLALPAETPASAAVVEPAPPPVAAKTAAPAHAKKSRPAAAPAGDGSVAAKDAAEGSGWAGAPPVEAPRAICASCGVVESVTPVQHAGQGSGLGAVAGGVLGGLVGHQAGGGRGKDAMTVIGAIGGGLAGHEIEKRQRSTTAYEVQVRMEDGSRRSFTREQAMVVGQRVQVEGDTLAIDRSSPGKP